MDFWEAYEKWQQECLREFNERYSEIYGIRKYTDWDAMEETPGAESWDLVEFAEDGTAYPHGIGGINYVPGAVTLWRKSKWYVE